MVGGLLATAQASEAPKTNTETIKENLAEDDNYWELDVGLALEYGRHYINGLDAHPEGSAKVQLLLSGGYYYHDFFVEVNPLIGRSLTLGYSLQRTKHFVVNLIAESLFQGFEQSNQKQGALLTGIKPRHTSLDTGIEAYYSHDYGETRVRILHDISNTHNGYVLAMDHAYPIFRKRWTIWPSYGVSWLSQDATNYYFGITAAEVNPVRPQYQPTSAFTHKFNLYAAYQVNSHLSYIIYADYILFSGNINNSPLVAPNLDSYRLGTGLTWSF
jgi:MipA family protein